LSICTFILAGLVQNIARLHSQEHVLAQEIRLGSPECFSSWVCGVWGWNQWHFGIKGYFI